MRPWLIPVACLIVTAALWWDVHRDLRALRTTQSALLSDIDELKQLPTIDVTGAPALGSETAVVTLIEFSDYECPFCVRHFTETMPEVAKLIDAGQLRYVFRDFPIAEIHPESPRAHQAAKCAEEQGRFWEMHKRLFTPPGSHTDALLTSQAKAAGLDAPAFESCLASGRHAAEISESVAQAASLGAQGTPAFFIGVRDPATNHVQIVQAIAGAQPFDVFRTAIAAVTARAGA